MLTIKDWNLNIFTCSLRPMLYKNKCFETALAQNNGMTPKNAWFDGLSCGYNQPPPKLPQNPPPKKVDGSDSPAEMQFLVVNNG